MDEYDRIEFLEAIHEITSRADEHIEFLDTLIDSPALRPELRLKFLQMQTTMKMLNTITRRLSDDQVGIEENLEGFVSKFEGESSELGGDSPEDLG